MGTAQGEEPLPITIIGLVLVGFVFWILAPAFDPYLPFTMRWFSVVMWGGAFLIVAAFVWSILIRILD